MKTEEINRVKTMQLASSHDGQPWICTVYFVVSTGNFYWLSFPDRRHSREVADNQKAAVAVAIHQDVPVVGVQAEGDVRIVRNVGEATDVLALYIEKYDKGKDFIERLKRGDNQHELYCLVPRKIMLFDERTQPGVPYRQIDLTD
jgi:uncharacterized protein YhbP (UPF0306 family)